MTYYGVKKRLLLVYLFPFFLMMAFFVGCSINLHASTMALKDGSYEIAVDLEGGTGKATVTSPCTLTVKNGEAYADIEWSSNHYDYMIVDGEKYLPTNEDGNSTFHIPVTSLDEALAVTADTTAMSTPHEIDYTLTFHSDNMTSADSTTEYMSYGIMILAAVIVILFLVIYIKRKRGKA